MSSRSRFSRYPTGYLAAGLLNLFSLVLIIGGIILGLKVSELSEEGEHFLVSDQAKPIATWFQQNLQINVADVASNVHSIGNDVGIATILLFAVIGVFISAGAAMLRAYFDTAVNLSRVPFT